MFILKVKIIQKNRLFIRNKINLRDKIRKGTSTINHKTFDPEIDEKLNLTLNKAQKREINYALSKTFGFGGHNASLLVKKHKE